MSAQPTLFDEVVESSGLAEMIAPFAVSRLLVAADVVPPQNLTPDRLRHALPTLEQGLGAYLRGDELEQAVAKLRALAG